MKQNLITDVVQAMLPYLNNAQTEKLQEALQRSLSNYKVVEDEEKQALSEQNLVDLFLSAKRIEGITPRVIRYLGQALLSRSDL